MTTPHPQLLAASRFLRGLRGDHIARLAGHARLVEIARQTRLFEEGQHADRFWLIQAGQAALDASIPGRGPVIIEFLGRGDVIGLSWLIPPFRWQFGAMATQPLQALEFDARAVRCLCEQDAEFGAEMTQRFLRVTLHRLQTTRDRLLDLSAHPELLSRPEAG